MANIKGYSFYSIADEAPTGPEQRFEILDNHVSDDKTQSNYIEWRQVLLKFNRYNRNRRKWGAHHARVSLQHPWIADYFVRRGGVPGENGHPINTVEGQKLSMERLVTIDPNNMVILLKSYEFERDEYLWGVLQTIDDGNGPGDKLRRSIIQGMTPSVSLRSLVPQRKNADGTIDVMGPGRYICWDRVLYPSDDEAFATGRNPFMLKSKDIQKMATAAKESATQNEFEQAITDYVLDQSDACKYVLDGLEYAAESASVTQDNMFAITTEEGAVFIPLEERVKSGIENFMRNF